MIIIQMIIAYLLGSIPSGVWIGKIFFNKDLQKYGSGNTGATNTFRILGVKAGIAAMVIDVLKGTVATLLPIMFNSDIHPVFIGIFAILGHVFSIYLKFKGGKAVATSAGVVLALHPIYLLIFVGVFLLVLFTTSTVSISSMIAVTSAAVFSFFLNDLIFSITVCFVALVVIYLHRENISRIKNGTESRIPFGLKNINKK